MPSDIAIWVLGALLSVNLLVLTVLGKFIKETYDIATDLDVLLNGRNKEQQGFVREQRDATKELRIQQNEMRERVQAQGRLAEQTAYAVQQLADAVDDMNGHDVDLDRLEDVGDRWRDERDS